MAAGAAAAAGLASNKWTPIVLGVLIVGVAAVGYFGVVKPILCKTGVVECKSSRRKKALQEKLRKLKALDPNYYRPTQITFSSHEVAKKKADEINDALTVSAIDYGLLKWGDDEEGVYAVLQSAGNKHNMSLISKYYQQRHGSSLADDLAYEMGNEPELERMIEILNRY